MKRNILFILALLFLLDICPAVSAAGTAEPAAVTITAGSGSCIPTREITIPVRIEGNSGFTNLAIALEYDKDQLSLTEINAADGLCATMHYSANTEWKKGDGSTCGFLVAASPGMVTENGILFTATFAASSDFTGEAKVTPVVGYMRSCAEDVKLFQPVTTDAAAGTIKAILAGDVTGDGQVEYDDVMLGYRASLQEAELTEEEKARADLDGDKNIDSNDVAAIYRIYTGG